jgi:hypothetical protein
VSGSSSVRAIRFAIACLAGMLCPALGDVQSARASGCHASDRPVLGHSFSWEHPDRGEASSSDRSSRIGLTGAFAPRHCPDDTPDVSKLPFQVFTDAQPPFDLLDPSGCAKLLAAGSDRRTPPPFGDRLERPPR